MGVGPSRIIHVLPTTPAERKAIPIATGFVDYFPDAMIAVAELSRIGNDQHNPGQPLHWDRSKSPDEADALMRHFASAASSTPTACGTAPRWRGVRWRCCRKKSRPVTPRGNMEKFS